MKYLWGIIGAVLVLIVGTTVFYSNSVAERANEGVTVSDNIKGNPDAEVVLVEYSDFQCPACAQFQPIIKDLIDQYGDQLAFEYRHFPLISIHPLAEPAARAAEAAGQQGKFFEFHDLLFERQSEWAGGVAATGKFEEFARDLELDIEAFRRHQRSSLLRDKIREDLMAAQQKGFTGTPTFELNGERMQFETYADFYAQIESALGIVSTSTEPTAENQGDATDNSASFELRL